MIPPRRSIPLDHEALPHQQEVGDWPAFTPDDTPPALGFWLVFLGGAILSACGFGWLILTVLP